jgi:signal peptidase I
MVAGVVFAALVLLLGVAVLWLRRRFLVVTVQGHSMLPTLRNGDRVLVRRGRRGRVRCGRTGRVRRGRTGRVRAGQITLLRTFRPEQLSGIGDAAALERRYAVVRPGDPFMIKRVVAVPGDPVPPDLADVLHRGTAPPPAVVPDGRIVVLGDNPASSTDSRVLGYLRDSQVAGVVVRSLRTRPQAD